MPRFGGYLLRFHLTSDWSRNNEHSRNFLWCSRFYGKDCNYPLTSPVILGQLVTKQISRYSGVILSRNRCRKIALNAFAKIEGSCPFLSGTARRKKSKKSLSSDWAQNLSESNNGLLLRPGLMTEGVERAAKRRMRPAGFHMTIYNLLKIWKAKTLKQTNR